MSTATWVCDSCETNNLVQARVCRVCQRAPGSVAGTVRPVPKEMLSVRQDSERPVFVESKHATQFQQVARAEPAHLTMMPTPVPPPAPPPRPGRPTHRVLKTMVWLAVAAFVVVLVTNLPDLVGIAARGGSQGDPAAPNATSDLTTPCPSAVATWLPDGGGGAMLVAAYTTDKHVITICQDQSGQLFYDGLVKGTEPSSTTHISLLATATATGYVANNNSYVYEINGAQVIVSHGGRELLRTTLTRTGP